MIVSIVFRLQSCAAPFNIKAEMGCAASSSSKNIVQGSSLPKDVSGRDEHLSLQQKIALPAIQGSLLPETVCVRDERVQVDLTFFPPFKWICFLTIHRSSGDYVGSGFKIHLPDVGRTAIVTSGHVTYSLKDKEYAKTITVKFPGEAPIEVGTKDLYAAPEYINSGSEDYDYGLILLPGAGNSDDGFGWSAIVSDGQPDNSLVTICGYPADREPFGTMWITEGKISSYTASKISYMAGGQSGSPVYTWYSGYRTVLGVHSYGGCPNSAPRFTVQMIYRFLEFMKELKLTSLRSVEFPDVYVRCDGTGVTKPSAPGGGTVNCQYNPPSPTSSLWKSLRFYIYPVEVAPSLALFGITIAVIESAQFSKVFIRMNSKGMNQFEGAGGGEVNCQYAPPSTWESYICTQEPNGGYSFRSVQFPRCYIRLDGRGVDSPLTNGGGTVNCQWYDRNTPNTPTTWERFFKEVHQPATGVSYSDCGK